MTATVAAHVSSPPSPWLAAERACLERFLPGLDAALESIGLEGLERTDAPGIGLAKRHGVVRLCIPEAYGGLGATPLESARVQRALGARAPSAAVALAMHHFTVATLVELGRQEGGLEWMLLEAVARGDLLLASAFAEGAPNGKILSPMMTLERSPEGLRISGVKRPCSLSRSMDLISVSLVVPGEAAADAERLAVALVNARAEGIRVGPFWANTVLAGAETGAVFFEKVLVDPKMISYSGAPNSLDHIQTRGLIWFQLLIAATYLGIASALVEKVLKNSRASAADRATLGIEVEGAMATLGGIALVVDSGASGSEALAQALFARYSVQRAIDRATSLAFELLGGRDFASSAEASYLVAAARGLNFHPPSRPGMADGLGAYLVGHGLYEL